MYLCMYMYIYIDMYICIQHTIYVYMGTTLVPTIKSASFVSSSFGPKQFSLLFGLIVWWPLLAFVVTPGIYWAVQWHTLFLFFFRAPVLKFYTTMTPPKNIYIRVYMCIYVYIDVYMYPCCHGLLNSLLSNSGS